MKASTSIKEFAAALAKAQGAMGPAIKGKVNPHFKSAYADLSSMIEALREPLADNGLSYAQAIVTNDKDEVGVEMIIAHASGEWMQFDPFFLPVSKADAQGFGSAVTYSCRYQLRAVFALGTADDDGNAATKAAPAVKVPATLTTGQFAMHKNAIMAAADEIALKKAYTAAYVAAQTAGDSDALSRFTDLKDVRKDELKPALAEQG